MDLHQEIAKVAYKLYMTSGCIDGKDQQNWLDAERIVLARHAGQDIEEPEGEEAIISEDIILDEIEEKPPVRARKKTVEGSMADMEVRRPFPGTKIRR